jgi:hypothetical protein
MPSYQATLDNVELQQQMALDVDLWIGIDDDQIHR